MSQMESFKCRLEEIREENKILVETKEMLEDQLESSRKRCAQIMSIENELYKYKAELHNAQLENENDKKRIEELEEENVALQISSKSSISESQSILAEMESIKNKKVDSNVLSEQLGHGMSKIHKLELENRKLRQENDDLRLNKFHEEAGKILELETENKKLSLTIQQLQKVWIFQCILIPIETIFFFRSMPRIWKRTNRWRRRCARSKQSQSSLSRKSQL